MTGPQEKPTTLDRIEARARQAVEYEEAGARKDGITVDETWDEWVYGRDVLALVAVARAARAQAEREPGALDTAIREALARLDGAR